MVAGVRRVVETEARAAELRLQIRARRRSARRSRRLGGLGRTGDAHRLERNAGTTSVHAALADELVARPAGDALVDERAAVGGREPRAHAVHGEVDAVVDR